MRRTVKIGSTKVEIALLPALREGGDDCLGLWKYNDARIELLETMHPQRTYDVLWHEMVHALLHHAGYETETHNEQMVDVIGHGVAQILRDNPWMGDYSEALKRLGKTGSHKPKAAAKAKPKPKRQRKTSK